MLNDLAIKRAKPPATLWDGAIPGFGLRVGTQSKTFFVLLDSAGNRKTIGRYGILTLAQARDEAKRLAISAGCVTGHKI